MPGSSQFRIRARRVFPDSSHFRDSRSALCLRTSVSLHQTATYRVALAWRVLAVALLDCNRDGLVGGAIGPVLGRPLRSVLAARRAGRRYWWVGHVGGMTELHKGNGRLLVGVQIESFQRVAPASPRIRMMTTSDGCLERFLAGWLNQVTEVGQGGWSCTHDVRDREVLSDNENNTTYIA